MIKSDKDSYAGRKSRVTNWAEARTTWVWLEGELGLFIIVWFRLFHEHTRLATRETTIRHSAESEGAHDSDTLPCIRCRAHNKPNELLRRDRSSRRSNRFCTTSTARAPNHRLQHECRSSSSDTPSGESSVDVVYCMLAT